MSLGNMRTNKAYSETVREIRDELSKWDAREVYIPSAKDARLEGPAVSIVFDVRGARIDWVCKRFDRVEDNVRSLFYAVQSFRLMDQRGIPWAAIAEAARKLDALPDPNDAYDVLSRVSGMKVTKASGAAALRDAYVAAVRRSHPDQNRDAEPGLFAKVQDAGKKVGAA